MKVHIIRVDDTEAHIDCAFREIAAKIGAASMDTVNLRDGRVMLVDDNGYETAVDESRPGVVTLKPTRARKPVNYKATKLYHGICKPGTTHQIVGDVAIVVNAEVAA